MKKYLLLLICINAFSQPGTYDTTFSSDGIATECQQYTHFAIDAAFQSNGKILSLGDTYTTNVTISLVRYNTNGTLDTTFAIGGFIGNTINSIVPPNRTFRPEGFAIQNDDKIVIMGLQQSDAFGNGFWVVRLLPNGAVDTTFNGTGYLDLFFGTVQDRGKCIKIQPDGKIIVAGRSGDLGQNFAMARINTNGTLDTSFGSNGKVQTTFFGTQSGVNSIALQPDGKIILGGWTNNLPYEYDFALIRYNSDGSIDTTFGVNGKVVTTVNTAYSDMISKVIIQSDGKIIAGGHDKQTAGKYTLVRYLPNGSLDTTFGTNGIALDIEYTSNCDIAQQVDGKIVLVGGFDTSRISYLRYLNNGQLDTSFPVNGPIANVGLLGYASTVLIQPDNKIVVCGSLSTVFDEFGNTYLCSVVIRLNPGTLSTNEFNDNEVTVYPNPASSYVGFNNTVNQFTKATLFNYLGQEVTSQSLNSSSEEQIDICSFATGVYLLKLSNETNNATVKIIKK